MGALAETCAYKAAGESALRRCRGTLACLYSWSASHVVQRVCFTVVANHGDDGVVRHPPLARAVIIQNVTKPKLALLHQNLPKDPAGGER